MILKYMIGYMRACLPWSALILVFKVAAIGIGMGGIYLQNPYIIMVAVLMSILGGICSIGVAYKLLFKLNPWKVNPDTLVK